MNEPRLNFFTRVYYSISGFGNYRYFLRQGTGKAVVYLLLLTLILGIVKYIPDFSSFNSIIDEMTTNFDTSIPNFEFSNGELKMEGNMPVILEDGQTVFIFDTSESPNEAILNNYDTAIMFTRNKMIQKTYANRNVVDLSAMKTITIRKEDIKQTLPMMKPFGTVLFVFIILFFIGGKFISALFISLIGSGINSSRRTNLSFQNIFKISVFSMTLPLVVCTLLDILLRGFSLQGLITLVLLYVLAAVYVNGAINSIRRELDSFYNELPPQ